MILIIMIIMEFSLILNNSQIPPLFTLVIDRIRAFVNISVLEPILVKLRAILLRPFSILIYNRGWFMILHFRCGFQLSFFFQC